MADVRAMICGCAGPALAPEEVRFLQATKPWGLILFRRNVVDRAQVARLTAQFREVVKRPDAPVLVDQEGGRVQRLNAPHWRKYPSAARFGQSAGDLATQVQRAHLTTRLLARDLVEVGIDMNCAPVLDVPAPEAHDIVGDRAYGATPERVVAFGRAVAEGLLAEGVLPIIKHMPGHGRATADSHLELPRVTTPRAILEAVDFAPFRALAHLPVAMTAHVVFSDIDPHVPATLSKTVIDTVMRGMIGFDGLIMTDDLSMKALSGSFEARTTQAFAAGVDLVLHCNGDLAEAQAVAASTPWLEGRALARAETALALRRAARPDPLEPVDALLAAWAEMQSGLVATL